MDTGVSFRPPCWGANWMVLNEQVFVDTSRERCFASFKNQGAKTQQVRTEIFEFEVREFIETEQSDSKILNTSSFLSMEWSLSLLKMAFEAFENRSGGFEKCNVYLLCENQDVVEVAKKTILVEFVAATLNKNSNRETVPYVLLRMEQSISLRVRKLAVFEVYVCKRVFSNPQETLQTYYLDMFGDTLSQYRSNEAVCVESIHVKHNQNVEKRIRALLQKGKVTPKERAVLSGLHWVTVFIDDDYYFLRSFTDMILLFRELSKSQRSDENMRPIWCEVAALLLTQHLKRGVGVLDTIFPPFSRHGGRHSDGVNSSWDLIGILKVVSEHEHSSSDVRNSYFAHYNKLANGIITTTTDSSYVAFDDFGSVLLLSEALAKKDIGVIGDYLIDTSFLHHFICTNSSDDPCSSNTDTRHGYELLLPKDTHEEVLKMFESFEYPLDLDVESEEFSEVCYLSTHVPLILTDYGEFDYKPCSIGNKAKEFINLTWNAVLKRTGDLDLIAEYLESIKIFEKKEKAGVPVPVPAQSECSDHRVANTEALLLSLQREAGNWGKETEMNGLDVYFVYHTTWAVLSALND